MTVSAVASLPPTPAPAPVPATVYGACVRCCFSFVFGGEARSSEDRRKNRVGDRGAGNERASGAREKTEEEREQWGWETGGAYSGAARGEGDVRGKG